jgi:hypothetical protein
MESDDVASPRNLDKLSLDFSKYEVQVRLESIYLGPKSLCFQAEALLTDSRMQGTECVEMRISLRQRCDV